MRARSSSANRCPASTILVVCSTTFSVSFLKSSLSTRDGSTGDALLEVEQLTFALQAAAVAGEVTVRADDPVAGHDDADRILAVGQAHGSRRGRVPDAFGQFAVGNLFTVRDPAQLCPHRALKGRAAEPEVQFEFPPLAREILGELVDGLAERRVVTRTERLVGGPVTLALHIKPSQDAVVAGDQRE